MSSLFRKEVLEARRDQWLGGISLVQPVRGWILAGFAISAALLVLAFLFFGDYTRRSRVSGQLVPSAGLVTVMAPAVGVIERLLVDEGESVERGEALAIVSVPRALASGESVADALSEVLQRRQAGTARESQSREELMRAQAVGIERQIRIAREELEGIAKEATTRDEQVRLARKILERIVDFPVIILSVNWNSNSRNTSCSNRSLPGRRWSDSEDRFCAPSRNWSKAWPKCRPNRQLRMPCWKGNSRRLQEI